MNLGRPVLSVLCLFLASTGCDGPLQLPDFLLKDNANDNTDANRLPLTIEGQDRAFADEMIELTALVDDVDDQAEYFYFWEYSIGGDSEFHPIQAAQGEQSRKDSQTIRFDPRDVGDMAGEELVFRVRVEEVIEAHIQRQGEAAKTVTIREDGDPPPVDPNEQANENGSHNDNENYNENAQEGNQNSGADNENENASDNLNENENLNENQNKSDPDDDDSDALAVVFSSDPIIMSMFEGFMPLAPQVSGGTEPYTYSWTPVENLQANGGAFDPDEGVITSAEVDFTPPASGDYVITLEVTDSALETVTGTVTISVNDFSPLQADAGPDQVAEQGADQNLQGTASGGSGVYLYEWDAGAPTVTPGQVSVGTGVVGTTTYTLTITDTVTGQSAMDSTQVAVFSTAASSCSPVAVDMGLSAAEFVAYDPQFSTDGQAIVVSQDSVLLYDLSDNSLRTTLATPGDGWGVAVDADRGRAFVSTRISGQFTRSVQVVDLGSGTLGCNIALPASVITARGMAVIPSSGEVLVAVSGAQHGLILVNPDTCTANQGLQNLHNPGSFAQPIDVAVLEENGLNVAVVANAGDNFVTLVPLADIVETPDAAGGSGLLLPQVTIDGAGKAIAADPGSDQVLVALHNGAQGQVQVLQVSVAGSDYSGSPTAAVDLTSPVQDQGLDIDTLRGEAYAAMGSAGVAVINIPLGVTVGTLQGESTGALSVAAQYDRAGAATADTVLIVGTGSYLSRRCP